MMSSADKRWMQRANTATQALALFMSGEIQLTPAQYDAFVDVLLAFLEEANNHKFRFEMKRE